MNGQFAQYDDSEYGVGDVLQSSPRRARKKHARQNHAEPMGFTPFVESFFVLMTFTFCRTGEAFYAIAPKTSPMVATLGFIGIAFVLHHFHRLSHANCLPKHTYLLIALLSAVFSFLTVGSASLDSSFTCGAIELWTLKPRNLVNAALAIVGTTAFFFEAFRFVGLVGQALPSFNDLIETSWENTPLGRVLLGRGKYLQRLALLWAVWLPQALLRYPGVPGYDAFHSLSMYYGINPWTTKHPAIYGLTIGLFADLGRLLGAMHIGIFLMSLFQMALLSFAVLHTLYVLELLDIPRPTVAISFVFFALCPAFITSITMINKDVIFCIAFLIVVDEIALLLYDSSYDERSLAGRIVLVALGVFGLSYRNNGVFIVAVTVFFLAIWHIVHSRNAGTSFLGPKTLAIAAFIVSIVATQSFTLVLNKQLEVEPASSRVIYSIPIQQVARYLCFHPDGFTAAELADLQTVLKLDHETCMKHYRPKSFDGVKIYFTSDPTREKSLRFIKLWLKAVSRDPYTCIDATIAQNACLFSPRLIDFRQYQFIDEFSVSGGGHPADFSAEMYDIDALRPAQRFLIHLYDFAGNTPLFGLTMQESLYVVLLLGCIVHSLNKSRSRWLLLAIPLLAVFFFVFVGPAIEGNTRYMYPIMWSVPLWLSLFLFRAHPSTVICRPRSQREALSA